MSGALFVGGSQLLGAAQPILARLPPGMVPAFLSNARRISMIIPDVVIEEQHSHRMQITQHPVATGTPVSDHAFILPKRVTMRCGFSNSNLLASAIDSVSGVIAGTQSIGGALSSTFLEGRAREVFQQFITLQESAQPFDVTTGKKLYHNMLIGELSVTTDHRSEYALMIDVVLEEVIVVNVGTATSPRQADQGDPKKTDGQTDTGNNPPQPDASPGLNPQKSWLVQGWNWITGK